MEKPEDRLEEGGFPGTVWSHDARDAAGLDAECDVREDVDALDVSGDQVLDGEPPHQGPRYASSTTASLATSSSVPSAMSRPSSITETRWQSRRSSAISWETMRKVIPSSRFIVRMASRMMSRMEGCTPAN